MFLCFWQTFLNVASFCKPESRVCLFFVKAILFSGSTNQATESSLHLGVAFCICRQLEPSIFRVCCPSVFAYSLALAIVIAGPKQCRPQQNFPCHLELPRFHMCAPPAAHAFCQRSPSRLSTCFRPVTNARPTHRSLFRKPHSKVKSADKRAGERGKFVLGF